MNKKDKTSENELRYIAYVRKSEKGEDKQTLSHNGQIRAIKEKFPKLNIVHWMPKESGSAFHPGRPIFNDMMSMIKDGKADAIVAWSPNRISRNEVDAGAVTYALRTKELKNLAFVSYTFDNSPEGIKSLQDMLSQGQYESASKGRDIKRGALDKIIHTGEKPGTLPQGYLKEMIFDEYGRPLYRNKRPITRTVNDELRFDLVKKMWQMLLSGLYTVPQIRKITNEQWGYLTPRTKMTGGKPITDTILYSMFHNIFYTGLIQHNGEYHQGKHEAMITLEEFDYAQKLLGKRGHQRLGIYSYTYGSLMRCGECGCMINGKTNVKTLKSTGAKKAYVHYYCPRKSEKRPCNQVRYTSLELIEQDIDVELQKYTILPEFRDLAIRVLKRQNKLEVKERKQVYESLHNKRSKVQGQIDRLIKLRLEDEGDGLILNDEEYQRNKSQLKNELIKIDSRLRDAEKRADDWLAITEKVFDFATYATIHFRTAKDPMIKRHILETLGVNFTLLDNQLSLMPSEWLVPIGEQYPALEKAYLKVRTSKKLSTTEVESKMQKIFSTWYTREDSNL